MIIVIADDFTGAAEITGIGLQYGLSTRLQTDFEISRDTELVVIDTDSRSGSEQLARGTVAKLAEGCRLDKKDLIYKKCDSVLRGHVLAELEEMLTGFGYDRVLLQPANPSLGRTISSGKYYVNGRELQFTEFADDPEYPAVTADVLAVLGESDWLEISTASPGEMLADLGIIVGDTTSPDDLANWAREVDGDTIPAGAAEFFRAILDQMQIQVGAPEKMKGEYNLQKNTLIILGSNSAVSRATAARLRDICPSFAPLPCAVTSDELLSDELLTSWCSIADAAITQHGYVIVTIDQPIHFGDGVPARLADLTALLAERVIEANDIVNLVIEGGATASRVLKQLGYKQFKPLENLASGVIALHELETSMAVITKVGSYPWPDGLLPVA
jgi:uncharacterized protein YgbK (DUF1537 family)